jgi:hypothetical protein
MFSFRNKQQGIRSTKCKICTRLYLKEHYKNNKSKYVERAKKRKPVEYQKTRNLLKGLKTQCIRCGEDHPAVLDFHHTNPDEKESSIARIKSRKKIIEESKKCIVLCSNCHRKLHWEERQ